MSGKRICLQHIRSAAFGIAALAASAMGAHAGSTSVAGGTVTWTGPTAPSYPDPNGGLSLPYDGGTVAVSGVTINNTVGNFQNFALYAHDPTIVSHNFVLQIHDSQLSGGVGLITTGHVSIDTTGGTPNTIAGGIAIETTTASVGITMGSDTISANSTALSVLSSNGASIDLAGTTVKSQNGDGIQIHAGGGAIGLGYMTGGIASTIVAPNGWGIFASNTGYTSMGTVITLAASGNITAKNGIAVSCINMEGSCFTAVDNYGTIDASDGVAISTSSAVLLGSTSITRGKVYASLVNIYGGADISRATFFTSTLHLSGGTLVVATPVISSNDITTVAGSILRLVQDSDGIYSHKISGAGSLQVAGAGTLTITGSITGVDTISASGTGTVILSNNTTGIGTISQSGAGTLIIDGTASAGTANVTGGLFVVGDAAHPGASLTGNVSVAAGGILQGHGVIHGTVTNGGTVAPGSSIGTLSVNSYTQNATGTLAIEVGQSTSDLLRVTNVASLAGTLQIGLAPGVAGERSAQVITANSITGRFSTVTVSGATDTETYSLRYMPTAVAFVMAPKSDAQLFASFERSSLAFAGMVNDMILTHAASSDGTGWTAWYEGLGGVGSVGGDAPASTRWAGLIGGMDYRTADGLSFGVALSTAASVLRVRADRLSANTFTTTITGGVPLFEGQFVADVIYLHNTARARRMITPNGGPSVSVTSRPNSDVYGGALEYDHALPLEGLSAQARIGYAAVGQDAIEEVSAEGFGFSVRAQAHGVGAADLGLRFRRSFDAGNDVVILPELSGALRTMLGSSRYDITAALPEGEDFMASGGRQPRSFFVGAAGVTITVDRTFTFHLRAKGRIGANDREGTMGIGTSMRF